MILSQELRSLMGTKRLVPREAGRPGQTKHHWLLKNKTKQNKNKIIIRRNDPMAMQVGVE